MTIKDNISRLGGKGAGLVWLTKNTDLGFNVPEFEIIDISFYEDYLFYLVSDDDSRNCPDNLREKCSGLAKKFNGKNIAIRSSGVISEDSDKFSGAGIYDTFFLKKEAVNSENLEMAVLNVYKSVNCDRAIQYRKESGLADEKMAVVVQKFADGSNGVAMSRLPAMAGIVPILWSDKTGAVVQGYKGAAIHTIYSTQKEEVPFLWAGVKSKH